MKHPSVVQHPDRFFIDGEWVKPSSGKTFDVVRPSTEEIYLTVAEGAAADIDSAVAAARQAFDHGPWPRMSHRERAVFLNEIGKRVTERLPEFAALWTSEAGITSQHTSVMLPKVGGIYEYYGSLAESFPFEERFISVHGGPGLRVHEAVGVVAAIVPWNAPLTLLAWKVAPALIAGCTVVVKVSPEAPSAGYLMAEIMREVGLPNGVFNLVMADRKVSEGLVRHPDVDKVTFTGSSAAGKKIASICGERIARCTLELGGKSAAVICDGYDLEAAASTLAHATRMMTGQMCAALTRIVVQRERQDELLEALRASFSAIKVGDPFDLSVQMGPLAMGRQRERVEHYIAEGRAAGATVVTGGGRPKHLGRGYFVEPTVFGNVTNDMVIAREEIFGPVVSVIPADSLEQAVDIANDTPFGLNATIFTDDDDQAYQIARRIRSGTVAQNGFKIDFSLGFGGFKQSGIGREGGTEGLLPFLESKSIILNGPPRHLQ